MGEKKTLAKARMELEELYLGIPDESVNLTFQDFADVSRVQHHPLNSDHRASNKKIRTSPTRPDPIAEHHHSPSAAVMAKIPSLDFSRGLHAPGHDFRSPAGGGGGQYGHRDVESSSGHHHHYSSDIRRAVSSMPAYDHDVSGMMSMTTAAAVGRRRPGIPHSNICTVCTNYIYLFRHRCLVCGRVYCRNCVNMGMGEMTEGRKCIDCLGRKFSSRYIHRAGETGGCWTRCFGYRSAVKQAELKWAEKGPRRTGRGSMTMSRSVSPMGLKSPMGPRSPMGHSNPPSFVATTPTHGAYSPYSTSHHLPF